MKNYAKVGGKNGKPAYRTPSTFISRQRIGKQRLKKTDKCFFQGKRAKIKIEES